MGRLVQPQTTEAADRLYIPHAEAVANYCKCFITTFGEAALI